MKKTIAILLCFLVVVNCIAIPCLAAEESSAESTEPATEETEEPVTEEPNETTTEKSDTEEPEEPLTELDVEDLVPGYRKVSTRLAKAAGASATLQVLSGYDRINGDNGGVLYRISAGTDIFGAAYNGMSAYAESIKTINGSLAYCVQPSVTSDGDKNRTVDADAWARVNVQTKETLALIMYYGYHTYGDSSAMLASGESSYLAQFKRVMNYMATQLLIWETCSGARSSARTGFRLVGTRPYSFPSGTSLYGLPDEQTTYYKTIKLVYDDIVAKMQKHFKIPAFASMTTTSVPEYTLAYNAGTGYFEYTLPTGVQDTLYGFEGRITLPSGVSFVKNSAGKVTGFRATAAGVNALAGGYTVSATAYDVSNGTDPSNCCTLYTHSTKQDVITMSSTPDPAHAYFKLTVAGKMRLLKECNDKTAIEGRKVSVYYCTNSTGNFSHFANFISDKNGVFHVAGNAWTPTDEVYVYNCRNGQYRFVEWEVGGDLIYAGLTIRNTEASGTTNTFTTRNAAGKLTEANLRGLDARNIGAYFYDIYFSAGTTGTGSIVGNSDCVVTVKNEAHDDLTIRKVSSDGKIEGISFTVEKLNASTGKYETVGTFVTNSNGEINLPNVLVGDTYRVTEIVPEGYDCTTDNPQTIVISSTTENVLTFENAPNTKIEIIKTSEDGIVEGIQFIIRNGMQRVVALGTTDREGHLLISSDNLVIGNSYYVIETVKPGYICVNNSQMIMLHAGTNTVRFENRLIRGSLRIEKVDAGTKTPLEGAGFRVFTADGTAVAEGYTNKDGLLTFDNLMYGEYYYKEFAAPEGFELDKETYSFAILTDGEVIRVTNENKPKTGNITVYKVDENGDPLPGVKFLLEYSLNDGETWAWVEFRNPDAAPLAGYSTTESIKDGMLTTDASGVAVFEGLVIDNAMSRVKYRITEVATKAGYQLLSEPAFENYLPYEGETEIQISVVNLPEFSLPKTGGSGISTTCIWLALVSAVTMTVVFFYISKRKTQEE